MADECNGKNGKKNINISNIEKKGNPKKIHRKKKQSQDKETYLAINTLIKDVLVQK